MADPDGVSDPGGPPAVPPPATVERPAGHGDAQQLARTAILWIFFGSLALIYAGMVFALWAGYSSVSGAAMRNVAGIYESATMRWPEIWDYIPAILVGFFVFATAPAWRSIQTVVLLVVILAVLIAYLYVPSFLGSRGVAEAIGLEPGPTRTVKALLGAFAGEIQQCMATFLAALLGLQLNKST